MKKITGGLGKWRCFDGGSRLSNRCFQVLMQSDWPLGWSLGSEGGYFDGGGERERDFGYF